MPETIYLSSEQPDKLRKEAQELLHTGFLARHRCERYEFVAVEEEWWVRVHALLMEVARG